MEFERIQVDPRKMDDVPIIRQAAVDAYSAAAKKANDLLVEMGPDEDEIVTEFDARRKAKRNTGSAP